MVQYINDALPQMMCEIDGRFNPLWNRNQLSSTQKLVVSNNGREKFYTNLNIWNLFHSKPQQDIYNAMESDNIGRYTYVHKST